MIICNFMYFPGKVSITALSKAVSSVCVWQVTRKQEAQAAAQAQLSEVESQIAGKLEERSSLQSSGHAVGIAYEQTQAALAVSPLHAVAGFMSSSHQHFLR